MDLPAENQQLEATTASQRLSWALSQFGDQLAMSTSFGVQSAATLHLVTSIMPKIPVIFIDTGYLFPETYRFAETLTQQLQLNLKTYIPRFTAARQEALWGKRWEKDITELDAYNFDNKVEPMNRAIEDLGAAAWISGLRRSQSSTRAHLRVIERQNKIVKVYPIIDWTDHEIYQYLTENGLPYHPLWEQGYVSVGDVHSTSKLEAGMAAQKTRFHGLKRECGLHERSQRVDFQI